MLRAFDTYNNDLAAVAEGNQFASQLRVSAVILYGDHFSNASYLPAVAPPAGSARRRAPSTRGPAKSTASSVVSKKSLTQESFRTEEEKHKKFSL